MELINALRAAAFPLVLGCARGHNDPYYNTFFGNVLAIWGANITKRGYNIVILFYTARYLVVY
jgi:hypothetical protein